MNGRMDESMDGWKNEWMNERMNEWILLSQRILIPSLKRIARVFKNLYTLFISIFPRAVGEDSLSHHVDPNIGVYIIDRFTYYALEFLERVAPNSKSTLGEFFKCCPKRLCISTVGVREDLYPKNPKKVYGNNVMNEWPIGCEVGWLEDWMFGRLVYAKIDGIEYAGEKWKCLGDWGLHLLLSN